MRLRVVLPAMLALLAFLAYLVPTSGLMAVMRLTGPIETHVATIGTYASIGLGVIIVLFVLTWGLLYLKLIRPLEELTREAQMLANTPQDRDIQLRAGHLLDRLPVAVGALQKRLSSARAETSDAVAAATRRADEQRTRLEAILLDLTEGVIVANFEHRILLYNEAAQRILELRDALGLGRPLFELLTEEPIQHVLEQLMRGIDPSAQSDAAESEEGKAERHAKEQGSGQRTRHFVCATVDLGTLLDARMSLVRDAAGRASGYVLTFADVGPQLDNLARRDAILREVMIDWRRPLANLTAAAEMMATGAELSENERRSFEEIVFKEVENLNARFREASKSYDVLAAGPWPMSDILSLDMFRAIKKHLADAGIEVTLVGVPVWLHADSHSLMRALEHLIRHVAAGGTRAFDIEAEPGERYAYIEIAWDGEPVSSAELDRWLAEPLVGTVANRTAAQIVERHGSELWSSRKDGGGKAFLRLPLKPTTRPQAAKPATRLAPRPEYYDFDLFATTDAAMNDKPLKRIDFVVFDTETTGLKPSEGDEMISVGAVRVVNGRILTGETFERLINPGRPIPPNSIRFHGITDEMVKDKPPARIVLPQFKSFVSDACLVAYNAAFDMKFLELKREEAGVGFDNPVLDALLLTIYLHKDAPDHSLSAMANRLGIEIMGRHTALGDAMMTAALWVRLLDLLEDSGVKTFGQAIQISTRMMQERRLASKF
ncbi:MAG: exonuclease domain-containing protein [Pseudomonadota bacterium]